MSAILANKTHIFSNVFSKKIIVDLVQIITIFRGLYQQHLCSSGKCMHSIVKLDSLICKYVTTCVVDHQNQSSFYKLNYENLKRFIQKYVI